MAETSAAETGATSPARERAELTADASNLVEEPVERAAKRLKMDDPADSQGPAMATTVPGEGLHDAPAEEQTSGPNESSMTSNGQAAGTGKAPGNGHVDGRTLGLAPIKKEYLIAVPAQSAASSAVDDDAAEGRGSTEQNGQRRDDRDSGKRGKKDKKSGGQNTERSFGHSQDAIRLCNSRANHPEFSPSECRFGDRCQLCHDLRKYLDEGRRNDVETLGGKCPVFEAYGHCPSGWKCRFVRSHMKEVEHDDGRKELVLLDNRAEAATPTAPSPGTSNQQGEQASSEQETTKKYDDDAESRPGVYNVVPKATKIAMNRKRLDFSRADQYIKWLDHESKVNTAFHNRQKGTAPAEGIDDLRARFVDPPFKPSEKRRIYFGPETPTLAPLTTQGNLPFRRLCVDLGAQITYSEMAVGLPLVKGEKTDWPLLKVHESELTPPKFTPKVPMFDGYDNARDLKFGAQISSGAYWIATKAADALARFCPHLRVIDINCGCPIDMVFKSGGGSALLDNHSKLERMIRGMNAVSGEIPITAKIRTGVKSNRPTATSLIGRLAFGAREHRARLGAPGCAAITLHGRSREQRYTKTADWGYIAECGALIKTYNEQKGQLTDTAAEPDPSTLSNTKDGRMYFLGNGDCYSHTEYFEHIEKARVDSVMIGRGALVKPWIFEEIEQGQYLDKTATERLGYVEQFVRYGLEAWGSDELGIGFTRRFLLEWLSFAHRYVPVGPPEHLPPRLNDRPPAYKGRNELETLLASGNYQDWIKISEMFLGPVHPGFKFQPKHKSNAYEAEG